jgi:hypothetical protein
MSVKSVKAKMKIDRQSPSFRRVRRRRISRQNITAQRLSRADITPRVKSAVEAITSNKSSSNNVHLLENNISKFPPGTDHVVGINARLDNNSSQEIGMDEIMWDSGHIKTTWTPARLMIEWDIPRPKINVEPHSIEITLRRRHRIKISYIPPDKVVAHRKKVDRTV